MLSHVLCYNIDCKQTQNMAVYMLSKFTSKISTISTFFQDFPLSRFLSSANFYKRGNAKANGLSILELFSSSLLAIFTRSSLNELAKSDLLNSDKSLSKSSAHRYMENEKFNWRKLQLNISSSVITKIESFNNPNRITTLSIDDSIISRGRSKNVEGASLIHDHTDNSYKKGFYYLLLAWSDGSTTIPVDFALTSSKKLVNEDINYINDRRCTAHKRKQDCFKGKPELVIDMLKRTAKFGIRADYVLFDTWFTNAPLVNQIRKIGYHVIGMLKNMRKTTYKFNGEYYTLGQIKTRLKKENKFNKKGNIYGWCIVETKPTENAPKPLKVKLLFVRDRNNSNKTLCLLCTDLSLSNEDIIVTYAKRWNIEVMFKNQKQHLKLVSGSCSRKYSSIIAYVTQVCICNTIIEYTKRINEDFRSIGGIFLDMCEALKDLPYHFAIARLINSFKTFFCALLKNECIKKNQIQSATQTYEELLNEWSKEQSTFMQRFLDSIGNMFVEKVNISC